MSAIQSVLSYLRVKEWYDSKVPFILCYPLTVLLLTPGEHSPLQKLLILMVSLLFSVLFLAYGYVINDFADLECDRAAGKKKVMQRMTKPVILLSLAGLVLPAAVLPLLYSGFSLKMILALAGTYFLGSTYSLPPFRFKERGVWGLVVSSFAQRCMPLVVIAQLLPDGHRGWFWFYMVLAFISGLRYIFIHQVIDLENDRAAGVNTFAQSHLLAARVGIYISFFLELAGLAAIAVLLRQPIAWIGLALGLALEWMQGRALAECLHAPVFTSFANVPLEGLENIVLPLALTASAAMRERLLWIFFAVLAVYLLLSGARRLRFAGAFLASQWRRLKADRTGMWLDLIQDLIMCTALSITIAVCNRQLHNPAEIALSVAESFAINWLVGFVLQVPMLGARFADALHPKAEWLHRLYMLALMVLIFVVTIGSAMYLLKIPDPAAAMRLFLSQTGILYAVGLCVSYIAFPFSLRCARRLSGNAETAVR